MPPAGLEIGINVFDYAWWLAHKVYITGIAGLSPNNKDSAVTIMPKVEYHGGIDRTVNHSIAVECQLAEIYPVCKSSRGRPQHIDPKGGGAVFLTQRRSLCAALVLPSRPSP